MNIGILTYHFASNSGAVLQAYALKNILTNLGHDVYIIDYVPEIMEKLKDKKYKILPNKKNLPLMTKIRVVFRLIYNFFTIANRITEYEKFLTNNLKLTRRVTKKELSKLNFDVYILGSDQIWNEEITNGFEDAYFGGFADKNKAKIISYAASLGGNKVDNEKKFERLLRKLDAISLREKTSVDFVKQYTDKEVVDVLDPTLLIAKKDWEKNLRLDDNYKKYVLFLSLRRNDNEESLNFAGKIAKKERLKVVRLVSFKSISKYKMIINTPKTFLNLIKNSKYIVTDSFHGVVFSIIFRKEFFVIKREAEKLGKTNSSFRIQNLLDKLQIKGRIIGEEIQEINYDNVDKILAKEREKSIQYLRENLK